MNSSIKKAKAEVYKRSEFSDFVSSNNFYTVFAIALVLGIATVAGFVQNPRKLKAAVDTITHKVSISHPNNQSMSYQVFQRERNGLSVPLSRNDASFERFSKKSRSDETKKYLFGKVNFQGSEKIAEIQRVSFSYDITSRKFWNNLNSSTTEPQPEDTNKANPELHPYSFYMLKEGSNVEEGDSKYSIASNLKKI